MPDGSPGFSLLIIITAEFGTGIQLGFGFTLLGVGGLLGLNRTMKLRRCAEGVRTGAIEQRDVPAATSSPTRRGSSATCATFFPPQQGTFLIGPMAKLGWGTPTLVSLVARRHHRDPRQHRHPRRAASARCPTEDARAHRAAGQLRRRDRVRQEAALLLRRAVRVARPVHDHRGRDGPAGRVGRRRRTSCSRVGGFHPRFTPPPLPFPSPQRIAVSILDTAGRADPGRGLLRGHDATPCSSARAPSCSSASTRFSVEGHLALRRAVPVLAVLLHHRDLGVAVGQGLRRRRCSASRLAAPLEGPTPWHAQRHAARSRSCSSTSTSTSTTPGASARDTDAAADRGAAAAGGRARQARELAGAAAAGAATCWSSLRKLERGRATARAAPARRAAGQPARACRSDLTLDKVGTRSRPTSNRFALDGRPAAGCAKRGDAREQFAPAQFQDMDDAEQAVARRRSSRGTAASSCRRRRQRRCAPAAMVRRVVRYEVIIIDTELPARFVRRFAASSARCSTTSSTAAAVARVAAVAARRKTQLAAVRRDDRGRASESLRRGLQRRQPRRSAPSRASPARRSAREYLATAGRRRPGAGRTSCT